MKINKDVYPDSSLRFTWRDGNLFVNIPDELKSLYSISISNDGYLIIIKRN